MVQKLIDKGHEVKIKPAKQREKPTIAGDLRHQLHPDQEPRSDQRGGAGPILQWFTSHIFLSQVGANIREWAEETSSAHLFSGKVHSSLTQTIPSQGRLKS